MPTERFSVRSARRGSWERRWACTHTRRHSPMEVFTLANARGMEVRFLAYGGTIISVRVPDRNGVLADVTPGFDSLDDYVNDGRYFGALVGRYGNRMAGARFTLGGVEYKLTPNEGANQRHGGPGG